MKLNKPGIYRIVGEKFELLANVIGEVPVLRIVNALDLNSLAQKGEFKVLPEESLQIQQVLQDPSKFIFIRIEFSDAVKLPPYRCSIRGTKIPNLSNEEYEDFKGRYIQDTRIIGRGASATKAYIMEKTDWSLSQIHMLIMKIGKEVRDEELRESKVITSYNIDL